MGFSLVELSIVLVILGLLVGGILAGQSLIRASEMNAIISEHQRYSVATRVFRDKYQALPGDMANATAFWGFSGGAGCLNSTATANVNPGVCDGDGDGVIRYGAVGNEPNEAFQGWRHMALAGLIEGSYTGRSGPGLSPSYAPYAGGGAVHYYFGTNSPASRLSRVGWGLSYFDNSIFNSTTNFQINKFNWLTVGGSDATFADDAFLKPEEAFNLDTKMDDGKPGLGRVHSWPSASCTVTTALTTDYSLSNQNKLCSLFFNNN